MFPVPLSSGVVLQAEVVKSLKLTRPVGGVVVVPENVAVSPKVPDSPAVPVMGLAWVAMVGLALEMTTCSLASAQPVVKALLFPSPRSEERRVGKECRGGR